MANGDQTSAVFDRDVLTLALQESSDALQVVATDGTLLASHKGHATAFGTQDTVGRPWLDRWTGEDRLAAAEALEQARSGARATFRGRLPAPDGTVRGWDSTIVPIRSRSETLDKLLVISRDVTEQVNQQRALERSASLHEALIRATSEIVWHVDVATGLTKRSGYFEFTGQHDDPTDMDGWLRPVHPEDRASAKEAADAAGEAGTSLIIEYRLLHRSGEWRWVEDHVTPVKDRQGLVTDWVGIITDIHDRKSAEQALRKSAEHLRLAVEATGLGTWDVDEVSGERDWSPELFDLLRVPRDTPPSRALFLNTIHPEDRARADRELTGPLTADESARVSVFRLLFPDGEECWIEAHERNFFDPDGIPIRRVGTMQDITVRKKTERQVWLAAHTDALTGIANRALFQTRLEQAVAGAKRLASHVGLLLIDLDRFKEVNDSLGHDAGDSMLRTVAERISATIPPSATVARLGGDEFGVIVPTQSPSQELNALACRLVAMLAGPLVYDGREIDCSASIGWSVFPDQAGQPSSLLKYADVALYAAKSAGRGRSASFEPAMQVELERRLNVIRSARETLARDAVMPFYQPKVSLATGHVIGFEALLRWVDESGLRTPGALQEALDDAELAIRLGARMLERTLADMQAWTRAGIPFGHVAVNVASPQFQGGTLSRSLITSLEEAGLDPGQLEIEVTERVLLDDGTGTIEGVLNALHQAGIRIALDDFGTGYASLTHLTRFPVSWVKIDRSFTSNLERDASAAAIVEAIIGLAHRINVSVIAEGIETRSQLDFLKNAGCDLGQGFLIAKPMSGSRVPHFLRTWAGRSARLLGVSSHAQDDESVFGHGLAV